FTGLKTLLAILGQLGGLETPEEIFRDGTTISLKSALPNISQIFLLFPFDFENMLGIIYPNNYRLRGNGMLTVRHIEKLWDARKYQQILCELISPRVEMAAGEELNQTPDAAAAALALIRLDELHQAHASLCSRLIRSLVSLQEADGGW